MAKQSTFVKNKRQELASKVLANSTKTRVLLYGGSRSGKTFMLVYAILVRAIKHPHSRHLILRKHFTNAKSALCYDTIPKVMDVCFPGLQARTRLNKQDWFYTLPNGSEIWVGGLDNEERADKILGREYVTIYFNEASELDYRATTTALTRLAQQVDGCTNKAFYDCNPPNKRHWLYSVFIRGMEPLTNRTLYRPERYACMQMNALDNIDNIAAGYIEDTLESMTGKDRERFLLGEFTDDAEGALWKSEWISRNRVFPPDGTPRGVIPQHFIKSLEEIVIAIDPAVSVSEQSDDTGIVVAGRKEGLVYILEDLTVSKATPAEWARVACNAYDKYKANWVVGERNQGGDLVKANIHNYNPLVAFYGVHAVRGKDVRAEPVASLSEQNLLKFYGEFIELEEELTSWSPLSGLISPNRLDAMVWAVVKLKQLGKRAGMW